MENNKLPFTEIEIENIFIRTFKSDTKSDDLLWHRDKEDRIIEAVYDTDWKFQFDNELPIDFSNKIYIKAETYHRLIKGSGELILKIKKI